MEAKQKQNEDICFFRPISGYILVEPIKDNNVKSDYFNIGKMVALSKDERLKDIVPGTMCAFHGVCKDQKIYIYSKEYRLVHVNMVMGLW